MTHDTCLETGLEALRGFPPMRCADAARMRGEPLHASAVRYSRFLLLEVPGAWGRSALDGNSMDPGVARQLAAKAAAAGVHVLLIRRPGRQRSADLPGDEARPKAWALADTSPDAETVSWGSWDVPADLLGVDLTAGLPAAVATAGPQRLALVCTNGKRDQCCAIRGRPVAAAIAAAGWDAWECSHLGGHRFAATIMLLPTGDMFGWLDPESAVDVLRRFDAGQLMLSHHRGRAGQPALVQAALHAAAVRLADFNRGAFRAAPPRPVLAGMTDHGGLWEVEVTHRTAPGEEARYRVLVAESTLAPALMSCADDIPKAEARYEMLSLSRSR
jgi:hypothetical protein